MRDSPHLANPPPPPSVSYFITFSATLPLLESDMIVERFLSTLKKKIG